MQPLNQTTAHISERPERILQFGKGNFLRAFAAWAVQRLNQHENFNGNIVIVEATPRGGGDIINQQDGLYHLILEGITDGKPSREIEMIDCVSHCINPYQDYASYQQLIDSPKLRFVISNTTEAGIRWQNGETLSQQPQSSFPGKVTALLHRRFQRFSGAADKGLIFLCCELIENNSTTLKALVERHASEWDLEPGFIDWVHQHCAFCNTLVDRIVSGRPEDRLEEIQQELGFRDELIVTAESYHQWSIEAPDWVKDEFPVHRLGLNFNYATTLEQASIRDMKVRILNGTHTGTMPVAYLSGVDTVVAATEHPQVSSFMRQMLIDEIIPCIPDADPVYTRDFAERTLERFQNPYIQHQWLSISLNSMSKWQTRNLPSLLDSIKHTGILPLRITFSLAALIAFYRGVRQPDTSTPSESYTCQDSKEILTLFSDLWYQYNTGKLAVKDLVRAVLSYETIWQQDLNQIDGLTDTVTKYLESILEQGMVATLENFNRLA